MTVRAPFSRFALLAVACAALGGCSTVGDIFSRQDPNAQALNSGANPRPMAGTLSTNPTDKPIVLPVSARDISCPDIDMLPGAAYLRVGGPENAAVRHQFNISDTARECDPAGPQQATLKIGVRGNLVIGPAGSAGTFSAPLKITVTQASDKKDVYSQTFHVEATTDGVADGAFRVVTDPIPLPMPTLQLADLYTISVGFEGAAASPAKARAAPRHRPKPAG